MQEEQEVPDDELLNDMIARNEDEMELFAVSLKCAAKHWSITGDAGSCIQYMVGSLCSL